MTPTIGMIIALPSEAARMTGRIGGRKSGGAAFARQRLSEGIDLLIGLSGMGIENAHRTAQRLVEHGAVALVNAGVSGGLAADLAPGDLVVAESVLSVDAEQVSEIWHAEPAIVAQAADRLASGHIPAHCGRIMTSARPILSAAEKKEYGEVFQSLAVDMESAGVAMAAGESNRPFFIMRAVCDPFTQTIPPWLFDSVAADGSIRFSKLFGRLIRQPSAIIDLLGMQARFREACKTLSQAWTLLCDAGFPALLAASPPAH